MVGVFDAIGLDTHEEVLFGYDRVSGLRSIIAIHSTALGPALGGTRFFVYPDEEAALVDVLRLSKGMTYKSAAAGLDLGGGKAVIVADADTVKSERLLRAYGNVIDSLGGRYITAQDVGTTTEDMAMIRRQTRWVAGLPVEDGGSGDPSPATARGVVAAMRAVAERLWGNEALNDRTVAVQGVGKVGSDLVARLVELGANVIATDVNQAALDAVATDHGAKIVGLDDIYDTECDIFAPCALGASLSADTIPRLRCAAVVGSANNQLAEEGDADRLTANGILYAPDFVVNSGGIIDVASGVDGYRPESAGLAIDRIKAAVTAILDRAEQRGINPHRAAEEVAEERIASVGPLRHRYR
ncbi:MAG: Glu/Leu/Phe/Val dehydrogenase [Acidimicrobiia bacterium]|nr:Glu/Leu/Phe/Val dehydrogenase [Acidimicrobiia bacterium]